MNKKDVLQLFKFLTAVYPQFTVDQYKIDEWTNLLADQSTETVLANAREYAKANKFPPSIAEVRVQQNGRYIPRDFVYDINAGEDWN